MGVIAYTAEVPGDMRHALYIAITGLENQSPVFLSDKNDVLRQQLAFFASTGLTGLVLSSSTLEANRDVIAPLTNRTITIDQLPSAEELNADWLYQQLNQ